MENRNDEIEIDLLKLAKSLLRHWWAIVLAAVIGATAGFSYATFRLTPMYRASTLMYVNNSTLSFQAGFAISPGELAAAQSLVETYVVITTSRNVLNEVIDRADLDYSYEQLASMVGVSAVNETEIFSVSVVNPDPVLAERIANTIADVLPEKIADIVDGSSVRVVDYAVVPQFSISPNVSKYTMMGFLLGAVGSCGIIVLKMLLDTTIRDEEYLSQTYGLPVLSIIPDLHFKKRNKYRYGYTQRPRQEYKEGRK